MRRYRAFTEELKDAGHQYTFWRIGYLLFCVHHLLTLKMRIFGETIQEA